ncbi:MAG: hypothetical protein LBS71_02450 [Puniceicoccales bacterium]|nr:hypothetical protein [Puniceicoccales bacterium]
MKNRRRQTAFSLTVGWGRFGCFEKLLEREEVNPDIPNIDQATPLIVAMAAVAQELIPTQMGITMAEKLIQDPRVNVYQRGTDNKLPLQIAFEAQIASQLSNAICRRALCDYDREVRDIVQKIIDQLPETHRGIFLIQALLRDPRVNVNYDQCEINELIDAIRRKIHFLLNELDVDLSGSELGQPLQVLDRNTQLFGNFLSSQSGADLQ